MKSTAAIAVLTVALLSAGCATRTLEYTQLQAGKMQERVVLRHRAVLTGLGVTGFGTEVQTDGIIAGEEIGSLTAKPDAEAIKAITGAVSDVVAETVKGVLASYGLVPTE